MRFQRKGPLGMRRLGLVATMAAAAPLLFGQAKAKAVPSGPASGAEPPAATPLTFEVSSIKLNKSGSNQVTFGFPPGGNRFEAVNVPLKVLVRYAYGVDDKQILGAPEWLSSEHYDIEAKVADTDAEELRKLSPEQTMLLLKPLLEDRLKLQVHRETRLLPVDELVVAKNGPKLKQAIPGETYTDGFKSPDGIARPGTFPMSAGQLTFQALPIAQLARLLSERLELYVIDKTGLTGNYDFTLSWTPEESQTSLATNSAPMPNNSGSSIFTALQEQLGLRLESTKAPVDFLIIDHVERPSEN